MTRRVIAWWTGSRLLLLVLLVLPKVGRDALLGDVRLYGRWGRGIADWSSLPYRDFGWEYPPGAAAVVTPPAVFGDAYPLAFLAMMLLADLAVLAVLLRLGARLGSDRGAWLWLAGTTAMGPIVLTRFDTVSALLALLAVLALASGAHVAAGLALGGGFLTKLWPAVLGIVIPYVAGWRRVLAVALATVAAGVGAVLAIGGAEHGGATLERHADRGLQVESVAATPVVVAERLGATVDISFHPSSGSWDATGDGVGAALLVSTAATLLALALVAILVARLRRAPELWLDVAATALLLVTVTGKVLSPQYVVWLLALYGAALCRRDSPVTGPAVVVAATSLLGQFVFPVYYQDLVNGGGVVVVAALALRNAALVVAAALSVTAVWRRTARP